MQTRESIGGFSLIEILVVIVIIGITASFAMLSFGDFGKRRKIVLAADNFKNLVYLVKKEAILETRTLAIQIKKDNYRVLCLNNNRWQPLPDIIFKTKKLPNGAVMFLTVNRQNPAPDLIIINPAGDMSPFKLQLGHDKHNILVTLTGNRGGTIKQEENAK